MITSHGENRPDGDVWAALLPTRMQAPPKPEEWPPGTPMGKRFTTPGPELEHLVRGPATEGAEPPSPGTPRKNSQSKEGEKP